MADIDPCRTMTIGEAEAWRAGYAAALVEHAAAIAQAQHDRGLAAIEREARKLAGEPWAGEGGT